MKLKKSAKIHKNEKTQHLNEWEKKREKLQKFLQHMSHSPTYTYFAHPIDFFALPILKKYEFYQIRFLFGT